MKRKIAILLVGALCLGACGQKNGQPENTEITETAEKEAQESSGGNTEKDPAGQAAAELEDHFPTIKVERIHVSRYAEDGETLLSEVDEDIMSLSGEGCEAAAEAVERLLGGSREEMEERADGLAEVALEQYNAMKDSGYEYFSPHSTYTRYEPVRFDSRLFSVKAYSYEYTGGAHGYGAEWGVTIDMEKGCELALPQMMEDVTGFWKEAQEVVLADLALREDELYEDYPAMVRQQLEEAGWYLDGAGIMFCFSPYAIGPYSSGTVSVRMPYEAAEKYMKPEYRFATDGPVAYVVQIPRNEEIRFPMNAAGDVGTIQIDRRTEEEITDFGVTTTMDQTFIVLNGQETLLGDNVWVRQAYLLHRPDGRSFLIHDMDWASDDNETFVYELTSGELKQTDSVWAAISERSVNQNRVGLNFILQVFGNHVSHMEYRLTADGKLEPMEERFEIASDEERPGLLLIKDLPVTVDGKTTVVPAGSRIIITATDNKGIAWFETKDGSMAGEIHYERREDDYQLYVDGLSEYEYFETLPYAG